MGCTSWAAETGSLVEVSSLRALIIVEVLGSLPGFVTALVLALRAVEGDVSVHLAKR